MKAMILAAGRGERMRPLTDTMPKPLLQAGGKALLAYHIESLVAAGTTEIVVNVAWQKQHLYEFLGDGSHFGAHIMISDEGDAALETGGGVRRALPLLGDEPFWLVNGDVYLEYTFTEKRLSAGTLGHLLLVPNPLHNPAGDFALQAGKVVNEGSAMLTYSGVAVLDPALLSRHPEGVFPLAPLLRAAADAGQLRGECYAEFWCDIGTPERLQSLDQRLRQAD